MNNTENCFQHKLSYVFGFIGIIMFSGSIFKTVITMFDLDTDTIEMGITEAYFACVGFVFALANRELGMFAIKIKNIIIKKLEKNI